METIADQICTRCKQSKSLDEFARTPRRSSGRSNWCKACKREYDRERYVLNPEVRRVARNRANERRKQPGAAERRRVLEERLRPDPDWRYRRRQAYIKHKWGLSVEAYEALLAKGCAICGSHEGIGLDHNHHSGKVRAALCRVCNLTLGRFGESPERFRAAAAYLEEWQAAHGDRFHVAG